MELETFGNHGCGSHHGHLLSGGAWWSRPPPWNNNQVIPIVCGVVGLALGLVCFFTGLEVLPATDPVTAAAVGVGVRPGGHRH